METMEVAQETLLLSIHPEYADSIFSGEKKIELRRTRPRVSKGDTVLVYVSSPRKELVGTFTVAGIVEDTPSSLWKKVKHIAAITSRVFDKYYAGSTYAIGIRVSAARTLPTPIPLADLRKTIPGFHPPQTYRYLSSTEVESVCRIK